MPRKRTYPNLKTWRRELGLSQEDAAKILTLSQPSYSRFESQARSPKARVAQFISRKTGVPLESVLGLS